MGDLNRVSHAAAKITILPGLEGYIDLNSLPFQGHKRSDVGFEKKNSIHASFVIFSEMLNI